MKVSGKWRKKATEHGTWSMKVFLGKAFGRGLGQLRGDLVLLGTWGGKGKREEDRKMVRKTLSLSHFFSEASVSRTFLQPPPHQVIDPTKSEYHIFFICQFFALRLKLHLDEFLSCVLGHISPKDVMTMTM